MADIIAFKGSRYNREKIKDFSKVVAPPYDVISQGEQDRLYKMNQYNIVRMLLGKSYPGDNDKDNKYVRAGRYLEDWQKKGAIISTGLAKIIRNTANEKIN